MNTFQSLNLETRKSLLEETIIKLNDSKNSNVYGCDLHNKLFNEDYFINGDAAAGNWLSNNGIGIFGRIAYIKEYENSNFGEVNTDFSSSENVCNMLVYIVGEDLLSESKHLNECWDRILTNEDIDIIVSELQELIN